jgi:hypothetical protein
VEPAASLGERAPATAPPSTYSNAHSLAPRSLLPPPRSRRPVATRSRPGQCSTRAFSPHRARACSPRARSGRLRLMLVPPSGSLKLAPRLSRRTIAVYTPPSPHAAARTQAPLGGRAAVASLQAQDAALTDSPCVSGKSFSRCPPSCMVLDTRWVLRCACAPVPQSCPLQTKSFCMFDVHRQLKAVTPLQSNNRSPRKLQPVWNSHCPDLVLQRTGRLARCGHYLCWTAYCNVCGALGCPSSNLRESKPICSWLAPA